MDLDKLRKVQKKLPRFVFKNHKANVRIRKARRTVANVKLENMNKQMGRSVEIQLVRAFRKLKAMVSEEKLYHAFIKGDEAAILSIIPWEQFTKDIIAIVPTIEQAMRLSGKNALTYLPSKVEKADLPFEIHMDLRNPLPSPKNPNARYDLKNPEIAKYISEVTGNMVTNITKDVQVVIQNAVRRSFSNALTPRDVARMIKGSIGLTPRYEQAVMNYQSGLEARNVSPERIDRLVDSYQDRLLSSRAMTIGRTEIANASNEGQHQVWDNAAAEGLIDKTTAKKVWTTDTDPCPICEDMDGEEVGLDEAWILPDGRAVMIPTESHPNCLCLMSLNI